MKIKLTAVTPLGTFGGVFREITEKELKEVEQLLENTGDAKYLLLHTENDRVYLAPETVKNSAFRLEIQF